MSDVPVGHRIRARRRELGLTQVALARQAGISPSYLNLIEHDRRRAGGGLMRRLTELLAIDPQTLSGAEDSRIIAELAEIGADPMFAEMHFGGEDATRLLAAAPQAARAILTLYRNYQTVQSQVEELSERVNRDPFLAHANHQILTLITTIRSFSEILRDYGDLDEAQRQRFLATVVSESESLSQLAQDVFDFLGGQSVRRTIASPAQEVDDVIHDHGNYFDHLEAAAGSLRARIEERRGTLHAKLIAHLEDRHGIRAVLRPRRELPAAGVRFDPDTGELALSQALSEAASRFRLARLVAQLEAREEIDRVTKDERLTSEAARELCGEAMLGYLAGAMLFPYEAILDAAEGERYDVDVLAQEFGGSFEQIAHRLTTLRRPGREGVPLHFMRTDIAGNISKRFSASGLRLPRYGGACPRWAIHQALLTPDRPVRQLVELPEGNQYLFVAQTVRGPMDGYGKPQTTRAIMIGCDAAFASRLVYSDGLSIEAPRPTPVGVSCPQCPREDCAQRAFPQATAADVPAPSGPARGPGSDSPPPRQYHTSEGESS